MSVAAIPRIRAPDLQELATAESAMLMARVLPFVTDSNQRPRICWCIFFMALLRDQNNVVSPSDITIWAYYGFRERAQNRLDLVFWLGPLTVACRSQLKIATF